ncbi:MAG: hypothetical protein HY683_08035 [Chloroflexi bacterium]|nr:hypothetical protein [Chloroflexota bacterium]
MSRFGEIIESSSTVFTAQCYHLYEGPPLGALVWAGTGPRTIGVVCNITTGTLDPGRRIVPRGAQEESEEEVYQSHPQLARLLATHIQAVIVGHMEGEAVRQYLPPAPPRIHAFVYACTPEETAAFTHHFDFLRLVTDAKDIAADEVLAACLRSAAACHPDPADFLLRAGKALALELTDDVPRLNAILRRVRP